MRSQNLVFIIDNSRDMAVVVRIIPSIGNRSSLIPFSFNRRSTRCSVSSRLRPRNPASRSGFTICDVARDLRFATAIFEAPAALSGISPERQSTLRMSAAIAHAGQTMRQACTAAGIDPDAPFVGIPAAAF